MTPETELSIVSSLAEIKVTLKNQDKILGKLDHTINGNGTPGLKVTVDRHEQSFKWWRRIGWAVLAPALAALGVGLLSLARNKQESPHEVPVPHRLPDLGGQHGSDSRM